MEKYVLKKINNLLITKAAIGGIEGIRRLTLLVDTGSTYTIIPVEVLESIGCRSSPNSIRVRLITASGYIIAPRVKVGWFHSLGKRIENFHVVAHTLPPESIVDGLLGMDFLSLINSKILIREGIIEVY